MWLASLLEAALTYRQKGYSVIPLKPGSKLPLIKWQDYADRLPTEDEIREWWKRVPRANIGVVTGKVSNLVAVDVDVDRGGSAEQIFELAPTGMISRTGSGGYHLLYKYTDDVPKNRVGKTGVDIRSNGGYIVVPPSLHDSGNLYKWVKAESTNKMSSQLVSYLSLPPVQDSNAPAGDGPRWLTDALMGVDDGNRNDTCAKLVGYYAGKGIPKDVTLAMMMNWDGNNRPPLGEYRVRLTVDSVYRTSYRYSPPVTPQQQQQQAQAGAFDVVDMNTYMSVYGGGAVKWIIPDWLPEDTIAFIASPPGTYKTWILLDLAVSIASGTPFLTQYDVVNPGPVILIQQEDHHGGIAERIGQVVNSKFNLIVPTPDDVFYVKTPPPMPLYFHTERKLKFNNKEIMDNLEKVVARIRPRLVIIDPLYSAAETDDYMAKSASEMFRLKEMRDKYHCTFIIAHHKKKRTEGNDREGLWGSQFLNAFLETGWQVRSIGDTSVSVRRHFKVKKESNELVLNFDINTERYPYRYKITSQESAGESDVDILKVLEDGEAMDAEELAQILGMGKTAVKKRLKFLEKDKMVVKIGSKYKALLQMTEF